MSKNDQATLTRFRNLKHGGVIKPDAKAQHKPGNVPAKNWRCLVLFSPASSDISLLNHSTADAAFNSVQKELEEIRCLQIAYGCKAGLCGVSGRVYKLDDYIRHIPIPWSGE